MTKKRLRLNEELDRKLHQDHLQRLRQQVVGAAVAWRDALDGDDDAAMLAAEDALIDAVDRWTGT